VEERGLLTGFFVCKVGVALAVFAFLGAALAMGTSVGRLSEREDLTQLADTIAGAMRAADSLPGEVEIRRELPALPQQFDVTVAGETAGNLQIVHIRVFAEEEVKRVLILTNNVNGGKFTLAAKNPRAVHLTKTDKIQLELI
jgi:hypothetical protein